MCFKCGTPSYQRCGCNTVNYPQQYNQCSNSGPCPIQLDAQCVIYHKSNNVLSGLTNLGLGNGATLELILDTIDTYIGQIKPTTWNLACLRAIPFVIGNLQQFAEAVDVTLCNLQDQIDTLAESASLPITPQDTLTVKMNATGTLGHTISADVNISTTSGNTLVTVGDGLLVVAQILQPDYADKLLTISNGNTIDMSGFFCDSVVWLGNVSADPSTPSDGQYWFRTDTNQLRIRLNGSIRTITIT